MAVVTGYGTGYRNPAALKSVDVVFAEGSLRSVASQIAITNGDSIASQYFVGRLPSNAILLPGSVFDNEAIAGNTVFSLGFAGALTALVNGVNAAGAALGTSALSAVTAVNRNKKVWQLAGFASDPGGFIDVIASLGAAATATGTMTFALFYSK